jgi:hypothetical protein
MVVMITEENWPVLARHERAAEWLRVWADLGRAARTIDAYARGLAEFLELVAAAFADQPGEAVGQVGERVQVRAAGAGVFEAEAVVPVDQAGAGPTTQRHPHRFDHTCRGRRAACVPRGQPRYLLRERATRAIALAAEQATDGQGERHFPAANGRVHQVTRVPAVYPRGRRAAAGTADLIRGRAGLDPYPYSSQIDPVQP